LTLLHTSTHFLTSTYSLWESSTYSYVLYVDLVVSGRTTTKTFSVEIPPIDDAKLQAPSYGYSLTNLPMMQITAIAATLLLVSFLGSTAAFAPRHASFSALAFTVNSNGGERPSTAPLRDKEESTSNDNHRRKDNRRPVQNSATDSAEFVVDLELADEVVEAVSPHHRKRRSVVGRSNSSGNNDAAGKRAITLRGDHATETDVDSKDSEQTSRNDGSTNTNFQKVSTSKTPSDASGRQRRVWEDRLSELADYSKIHGHCNVPQRYSENTNLAFWVNTQRSNYRLHLEGKASSMTAFRIQELESLGFEWGNHAVAWEDRLSELADYRKLHGHCNVPSRYSENIKLGTWVRNQRSHYNWHLEGRKSVMTILRIQALESLGFEWSNHAVAWEDRLSELADYRKLHGHCNVPQRYSENIKLGQWVAAQRSNYRFYQEGKTSSMTAFRIQELESLGFEWVRVSTAWEDRLSELADYRKLHGHCNVPQRYSENIKLGTWVANQRQQYNWHLEGITSPMTTFRIQALESLGFEWVRVSTAWEDRLSELADYRKLHGHCNVPQRYSKNIKLGRWVDAQRTHYKLCLKGKASQITLSRIQALESLGFEWKPSIGIGRGKGTPKTPSLDDDARRSHKTSAKVNLKQGAESQLETEPPNAHD
jgi:hypothetical protein